MARTLDPATANAFASDGFHFAWYVRLDILGDPIIVWTGLNTLVGAGSGDAAFDGQTFQGMAAISDIGQATDSTQGSEAMTISVAGVDINDTALLQIVNTPLHWQYRQAWVWCAVLDDNGFIVGKPVRVKSGRMDQMNVTQTDRGIGTVDCSIESFAAYAGESLNTRYSEAADRDPTDTSSAYVHNLINQQAGIGDKAANATNGALPTSQSSSSINGGGAGGSGGGGGAFTGGGGGGGGNGGLVRSK